MNEICGNNRFEIISKAKKHLLDATNIDTSPKEMEVLDDFLFRCWQMGWLDRYGTADTPQTEYPCETCANKGDHDGKCRNCVVDSEPIRLKTPSNYESKQTERKE